MKVFLTKCRGLVRNNPQINWYFSFYKKKFGLRPLVDDRRHEAEINLGHAAAQLRGPKAS